MHTLSLNTSMNRSLPIIEGVKSLDDALCMAFLTFTATWDRRLHANQSMHKQYSPESSFSLKFNRREGEPLLVVSVVTVTL